MSTIPPLRLCVRGPCSAHFAVALAAALTLVGGCTAPPPRAPSTEAPGLRAAYVVLGPDGRAVARAVTSAADCPPIELDGAVGSMAVRMPAATEPLRPTASTPALSKPSAFPVLTCERAIPDGTRRATVGGRAVPLPRASPQRVVILGDTGCRIKVADSLFQACNDSAQWPFAAVAQTAAAGHPDLVIHVGDYHYRENPCPAGAAGCADSPWGYGFDAWNADLFEPAQPLFAAAPWIVVRGNHEICARAGQGWWRFLDPRPLAPHRDCNDAADDAIGDYSEPYAVPIERGSPDAQVVVFDSALVGISPLDPQSAMYRNYRAQFEQAFALAARFPQSFLLMHHPVLGFAPHPGAPDAPYPGNAGLQSVLAALQGSALFPADVQALVAGHVHDFQALSFSSPHPPQFVIGNGGDWVDPAFPLPLRAGLQPAPGAEVASFVTTNRFGFATMERAGDGWTITARDVRGAAMTTCTLLSRKAICRPAALLQ